MTIRNLVCAAAASLPLLAAPAQAQEQADFGLILEASTLGLGADIAIGIDPNWQARVGFNLLSVGLDIEDDGDDELEYDGDLDLISGGFTVDWYPWAGSFRVSGGLFINGNHFQGSARCDELGGCSFGNGTVAQGSRVNAEIDFNGLAPYLGVGWGNPLSSRGWGFIADVGLFFQGSGDVEFDIDNCLPVAVCVAQAGEEEEELEDDIEDVQVYPVVNVGVRYTF